ncbi:DUF2437 domain-containing protein, partial [Frankia sp. Cas4]|uniref:DUF2437 domain-containing protein n=1 Tax=Frankia sp. Cas4 TaxID=3073927 RepID=UPI002AD33D93
MVSLTWLPPGWGLWLASSAGAFGWGRQDGVSKDARKAYPRRRRACFGAHQPGGPKGVRRSSDRAPAGRSPRSTNGSLYRRWVRIARFTDGTEPAFGIVEGALERGEATVATITPHPFGAFSFTGAR